MNSTQTGKVGKLGGKVGRRTWAGTAIAAASAASVAPFSSAIAAAGIAVMSFAVQESVPIALAGLLVAGQLISLKPAKKWYKCGGCGDYFEGEILFEQHERQGHS